MLAPRLADPLDRPAVGVLGRLIVLVVPPQIAQLHQSIDPLGRRRGKLLQQRERLVAMLQIVQGARLAQLGQIRQGRVRRDGLVGLDRGFQVALLRHHVADQERRLGQIAPREDGKAGVDHRHPIAALLVQRLGDAQERVRDAALGVVERRRRRRTGLERRDQIDQDRLLAAVGELLADHLDRRLALILAGQHVGIGLEHPQRRRAGIGHGLAQSRQRLVQTPSEIEHHRPVVAVERAQRLALVEAGEGGVEVVAVPARQQHPGVDERHGQAGDALVAQGLEPAMRARRACRVRISSRASSSCASGTAASSEANGTARSSASSYWPLASINRNS